jgi:subtilisin family serine protease
MKKPLLTALCLLLIYACALGQQETVYYYYKGAKVTVPVTYQRLLVGVKKGASFANKAAALAGVTGLVKDSVKPNGAEGQYVVHLAGNQVLGAKLMAANLLKNKDIAFVHPFLTGSAGGLVSYGQSFVAKLKATTPAAVFKDLLTKYKCTIVQVGRANKATYLIDAGQANNYDCIKMANLFFETGLFEYVQPDFTAYGGFNDAPNDPLYNLQWAHKNTGSQAQFYGTPGADMRVDSAWLITMGSSKIKVAVIDSGVDTAQADLKKNLLQGYDCITQTANPGDGKPRDMNYAHGTACAGIIASGADNGIGTAGIAPNCSIIPVNIAGDNDAFASEFAIATGMDYAWQNGADVLSNSWTLPFPSNIIDDAIHRAVTLGRGGKGCLVFFGAGNENSGVGYPAFNPEVIAVGGVTMCNQRKSFTSCDGEYWWGANYGVGLDVVAPCVKIATADISGIDGYNNNPGADGDYNKTFNGTSAACPHAAAVAALVLSVDSNFTAGQVRVIIEANCDKAGDYSYKLTKENINGTWNEEMGYGRVNAYKSVLVAKNKAICNVGIKPPASPVLCKGASVKLVAESIAPGAVFTWRETGVTLQTGDTLIVATPGKYDVMVTSLSGCTAVSAAVIITAADTAALKADAGGQVFLCTGSNGVRIGGIPSAVGGTPFMAAKRAFGYDLLNSSLIKFSVDNPREFEFMPITPAPEVDDRNFAAGDFTPHGYFALTHAGVLYSIDTATGIEKYISTLVAEQGDSNGHDWSGLAWDPERKKLYAITFGGIINRLYEVDLYTGIAVPGPRVNGISWIAFTTKGGLYGFSYNLNRLSAINKYTGGINPAISDDIGVKSLAYLDGSFDPTDNKAYLTTYAVVNQKLMEDLRVIDTFTHKVMVKGIIGRLSEVGGLAISGGTYQYAWAPAAGFNDLHVANPFVSPTKTITYTLTVKDACGQTATSMVTVTPNSAPPAVAITATNDSICVGDTSRLSVTQNSNYRYQWLLNGKVIPGAEDTFLIAKRSGRFVVNVTNGPGGCAASSPQFFVKDCSMWLNNNKTDTACGKYFYAGNGLTDTSFSPGESFTKTIYPSTPGGLLKIRFNSVTMNNPTDALAIYDGPDDQSPLLQKITSTFYNIGVDLFSKSGPLTFKLTTSQSASSTGNWDAFIDCYLPKVYRTVGSGDIDDIGTWEVKTAGNTFTYATETPRSIDDSIIIRSGHTITKSRNVYSQLDQLWLQKGAKLIINTQVGLTNGKGYDLVADGDIQFGPFGYLGGGDSVLIRGNISGEKPFLFSPCFIGGESPQIFDATNIYFTSLHLLNKTSVTIGGLIKTDSIFMNTPGRLNIDSAEIGYYLRLDSGIIDIKGAGNIKAASVLKLRVAGGNRNSFVNGPLSLPVASRGTTVLRYPVGKNYIYKPVTLTVNQQGFPYEDQYKVQVFNQQPGFRNFADGSLSRISSLRYYHIESQKQYPLTSASITLPFGDDDGVVDPANLRIARDSAFKWANLGGNAAGDSITSTIGMANLTNGFNMFGDYVLANATGGANTLPVTFINFTAAVSTKTALLKWTVTNEVNCDHYVVEFSPDGLRFEALANIPANTSPLVIKQYQWQNAIPSTGTVYFRIKQVDKNGLVNFSAVGKVHTVDGGVSVSPNPAGDFVAISSPDVIKQINFYSPNGQLVIKTLPSSNLVNVPVKQLPAGIYVLRIITGNETITTKLIKQ